ncbi:unnamed protein product [Effrenium voratum]|uniref:Uncharacterized protein n=1 Tax=Effrenium voratum TaxID=2562239 RepID=A0AA36HZW1_9DINO|nr:unnamed protein product [Effrenium voratum]
MEDSTEASEVLDDCEACFEGEPVLRTKTESWTQLPEGRRGIRVSELWDFYRPQTEWLEQLRWRCDICHQSCVCAACLGDMPEDCEHQQQCSCGGGDGAKGEMETRNLYEVAAGMIIPACAALKVSYVELLRRRGKGEEFDGVKPDTFVSHWWGEEFPKFVRTLTVFAEKRCTLLPWLHFFYKQREYETWSFWICAFANNQFAIDHALGDFSNGATPRTAVMSSAFASALDSVHDVVAVLDDQAKIYTRIWCCFELFSVARLLPQRRGKSLEIFIANESGVVSSGCGDVSMMSALLEKVQTKDAEASNLADKAMIEQAMMADGTSHEDLDRVLRALAQAGDSAFRHRRCLEIFACVLLIELNVISCTMYVMDLCSDLEACFEEETIENGVIKGKVMGGLNNIHAWGIVIMDGCILVSLLYFLLRALRWWASDWFGRSRHIRVNLRVAVMVFGLGADRIAITC